MPSYFYHLAIELFARPHNDLRSSSPDRSPTSLSFDSACEALLPFHKRPTSNRSPRDLRATSTTTSRTSRPSTSDARPSDTTHLHPATTPPHPYTISQTSTPAFEKDLRLDKVSIACIDMIPLDQALGGSRRAASTGRVDDNPVATGIGTDILGGLRTKGKYIPLDQSVSESVWGIVHLYRDLQDTPSLTEDADYPPDLKGSAAARQPHDELGGDARAGRGEQKQLQLRQSSSAVVSSSRVRPDEEDCTTLCILAVPSYMSPSDFLGFVGEATMDDVSHFRMIRTARANRYMVLMKFRSGRKARDWQREWNGKVFNSMEVGLLLCYDPIAVSSTMTRGYFYFLFICEARLTRSSLKRAMWSL